MDEERAKLHPAKTTRDVSCQACGASIYIGLADKLAHNQDGTFHLCASPAQCSNCDFVGTENTVLEHECYGNLPDYKDDDEV
jgi:hypothetical protein